MQKAFVISLLMLPALLFGQNSFPFPGAYVLEGYLLQEDTLMLTARESIADSSGWMDVFTFEDGKNLAYELEIPNSMAICGNGLFYVEHASWKYRKGRNLLQIDMLGGHMIQDSFRYKALYKVEEVAANSYRLVLHKVKRKAITPDGQIPDQISAAPVQEHTPTGLEPGVY